MVLKFLTNPVQVFLPSILSVFNAYIFMSLFARNTLIHPGTFNLSVSLNLK